MGDWNVTPLRVLVFAAMTCALGGVLAISDARATMMFVAAAVAGLATLLAYHAVRDARLTRALRARTVRGEAAGVPVRFGTLYQAAFVAGLRRPEIFCDTQLEQELTRGELQAVALHERGHQLAKDPLRLALVAVVTPLMRLIPHGESCLTRLVASREIAADRFALRHGATRAAVASALLKVAPGGPMHAAAFSTGAELRLRALLGEDVEPVRGRGGFASAALGALAGAILCVAALHPLML